MKEINPFKDGIAGHILINPKVGQPLIISIGGTGQAGNGSEASLIAYRSKSGHIPSLIGDRKLSAEIMQIADKFSFAIPQYGEGYLDPPVLTKLVNHLISVLQPSSIALMGISAGGQSTWKALDDDYLNEKIDMFVPMAGPYNLRETPKFKKRVWAFHGWNDPTGIDRRGTAWNAGFSMGDKMALIHKMQADYGIDFFDNAVLPPSRMTTTIDNATLTIFNKNTHNVWNDAYNMIELWREFERVLTGSVVVTPPNPEPVDNYAFLKQMSTLELFCWYESLFTDEQDNNAIAEELGKRWNSLKNDL